MIITYSYLDQYNQIGAFDTIDYFGGIVRTPVVAPAGRTTTIAAENRMTTIAAENRTTIIPAPN